MDLLNKVATTALLGFVVSSMMTMGLGFTVRQIIDALRDVRLVLLALLANFVAMPLGALALDKMLRLDEPLGVGLLLLGAAAGAPFLPKLTELAKGNLPFAVGIMVLLAVGTVGYLPLVLPLLLPGISIDSKKIAGWLFLLTLLPLAGGLALRARYAEAAARVKPVLDWVQAYIKTTECGQCNYRLGHVGVVREIMRDPFVYVVGHTVNNIISIFLILCNRI